VPGAEVFFKLMRILTKIQPKKGLYEATIHEGYGGYGSGDNNNFDGYKIGVKNKK
jgi:hypothetical protein